MTLTVFIPVVFTLEIYENRHVLIEPLNDCKLL